MKCKVWLVCVLVFLVFNFTACQGVTSYSLKEEDYYGYLIEVKDAQFHMPKLDELGEYESIRITRRKPNNDFISTTDSIALFVTYTPDQFEVAKADINLKYNYLENVNDNINDINAEVNGFNIKVVDKQLCYEVGAGRYEYPYSFLMIGYNQDKKTIVYMFHYEHTIGMINDLDDFIQKGYYFLAE